MAVTPSPAALVVLISGRGLNLQAILDAAGESGAPFAVRAVISNRADAPGLARARQAGVATRVLKPTGYPDRPAFDRALADAIDGYQPDIVALAGFMRVLDSAFVQRFEGRLVNIHPSLLPKHRGLDTHRRALAAGDTRHGATVHFVTEDLDAGPGLLQGSVAIKPDDTPAQLAQRVLERVETRIYPRALAWLATGRAAFVDGRACLDGHILETPNEQDCDS